MPSPCPIPLRAIVTRPAPEAQRWAQALTKQGVPAEPLPLIEIGPPPDPAALRAAVQELDQWHAVMFVSSNAAAGFMECFHALGHAKHGPEAIKTRAWAPGGGTARGLCEAGWPQALIDQPGPQAAQFDSEALWAQVAPQIQPGARVLIVRGADESGQGRGRDWLAQQIEAAGGSVRHALAYSRKAPAPTDAALTLARAALTDGSVWLFSSSQAVTHLRGWLPDADFSQARALATHPRIAQTARAAGFGQVDGCRPLLAEVARAIQCRG